MRGTTEAKITAMVVEDETKIGMYIKDKIECLDPVFSVEVLAENGKDALDKIRIYKPGVVFTDISMPVMDGLELARQIHSLYPWILVVIISGYSDFGYAQKAIKYGVFHYILKPLEDEQLCDALFDIKKNLIFTRKKQERQIICSNETMFQTEHPVRYILLFVCVGNLMFDPCDVELKTYYEKKMEEIPWQSITEQLCAGTHDWYLADELAVNQKILGIQTKEESTDAQALAERLLGLLLSYTDQAVHIALSRERVVYERVWDAARHCRFLMQKNLVPGKSQILLTDGENDDGQGIQEIVKMKLNSYFKKYFITMDLKGFSDEIQAILRYMIHQNAAQQSIEKVSLYVLRLLEFSGKDCEPEFLDAMQEHVRRGIGLAATEEELEHYMLSYFEEIERYMERLCEKMAERRVVEYVDNNFLTLESMEQVADVFGYNYTYLSRMFKKVSGMSMNKYITEKKIAMAKRLLREQPDMLLEETCAMCGYNDCRYFSKVFKSRVGVTPSEYRKNG